MPQLGQSSTPYRLETQVSWALTFALRTFRSTVSPDIHSGSLLQVSQTRHLYFSARLAPAARNLNRLSNLQVSWQPRSIAAIFPTEHRAISLSWGSYELSQFRCLDKPEFPLTVASQRTLTRTNFVLCTLHVVFLTSTALLGG